MGSYAGKNEHDPEGGLIMPTVVGIRFKKAGKIYYFDPDKIVTLSELLMIFFEFVPVFPV